MKSLTLKVQKIVNAYKVLDNAKYQKMSDDDKVRIWKISRVLGPIAMKAEEESKDAQTKFIPNEEFQGNLQKARQYEKLIKEGAGEDLPMNNEEYAEFAKEFKEYITLVEKALKENMEKEVSIEFNPLSEDAFGKLMASNDWTLKDVDSLEFIIQ